MGHIVTDLCMNVYLHPFCFPAFPCIFVCRLEDFPTSPTSTAKQEFLYVLLLLFMGSVIDLVLSGFRDNITCMTVNVCSLVIIL